MRDSISFYLNGVKKTVKGEQIFLPLSSYLRFDSGLTGTKVVCAEGDCGACTVMMAKWFPALNGPVHKNHYVSINSCIAMVFAMDGASLVTVEALGENGQCSEVQNSMIRNFSSQCGFCTPGFVMSITNMFEHQSEYEQVDEQSVKNHLTGNLCRCTGYKSIIQAALDVNPKKHIYLKDQYPQQDLSSQMEESILIRTEEAEFFAPVTLAEACLYKEENPETILFSGSTDLGVQLNKGYLQVRKILSLHLIKALYQKEINDSEVTVGSRVTISEVQELIKDKIPSMDKFFHIFASPQIKNAATLVGNIANASPIADSTPVLMALDAEVVVQGVESSRVIPLKDFYLGYKKIDLKKDEIITQIKFKVPSALQKIENYKISQRRDLDISTINASFNFSLKDKTVESARIVYGGVAATTLRLTEVEKAIKDKEVNRQNIDEIKTLIQQSIHPLSDVRGSADYRKLLAENLFEKYAKEQLGL